LEKIDSLDFLDGTRSTFSLEVIILHYWGKNLLSVLSHC
jgi:hypothetical protein